MDIRSKFETSNEKLRSTDDNNMLTERGGRPRAWNDQPGL